MLSERTVCEFMDKQASAFSPLHILGIRLHFICREFYGSKARSLKKEKEKRREKTGDCYPEILISSPLVVYPLTFLRDF